MKFIFTSFLLLISITFSAQIVNIPDVNFKQYLLWNREINTNYDNQIQVSEAANYTGLLDCNSSVINDLTGIEAFINLTDLYCYNNPIKTLDISKNIKLVNLWCESNQLTNLDISKNTLLNRIDCSKNQLKSLDISKNTLLEGLNYNENQIASFNYSIYPQLKSINCAGNGVSNIDISKNINLIGLNCSNNQLTTLDISKNLLLENLHFTNNQISSVDTSKHLSLKSLTCGFNLLKNLDISKNLALMALTCDNNQLISLNLKNGQNDKIQYLTSYNNPNLFCIQVDAGQPSGLNWWKDSWANYSTNCSLGVDDIKKSSIQIFPNPVKEKFTITTNDKIENIEIYSQTGQLLKTAKSKEVNISNLLKGNYLVKIKTDKENITQKIIKE